MRRAQIMLAAAAALAGMAAAPPASASPAEPGLFDAAGYRTARYRSPVRADPAPAEPISLAAAMALRAGTDAVFVDVTPADGGVRDPDSGAWSLSEAHLTIPGALWHPETGRAPVDADLWHALERAVHAARGAASDKPVVVFCRIDCWMSWNAARRLALQGLGDVRWLAEGTDGWQAAGGTLVAAVPVAVPRAKVHGQKEN